MLQEIGFNGGVPITEEYYIENFAGKHNDDVARILFPDDFERGLKFTEDKEAMFRRFVFFCPNTISKLKETLFMNSTLSTKTT
ncbi:haloacid dehalogenase-like hydrolase domain-containing protein Sgpp isoform X4 [Malus domestica]|uniref:haloacid dehalogenase-like hydrolase domain-containing protein Sgpp isoform X4 n=1 Tax=Malus domestica TaxID=3750 RepID=UPI00397477FD